MKDIRHIFEQIPSERILAIADATLKKLTADPSLIRNKDAYEMVTEADHEVQRCLLDYFAASKIAGKYKIIAEEELDDAHIQKNVDDSEWQLIVDPIDGTHPFIRGEETWGSMVGLCDRRGRLAHSWIVVSSGQIYSSFGASTEVNMSSSPKFRIDVCDYGCDAVDKVPDALHATSRGKLTSQQISVTTYPSAAWAGWELYNNRLDALLWLPSTKGKKFYPEYDCIFVGPLKQQGWHIRLGRHDGQVQIVAIAKNEEQLGWLWEAGLKIIPPALNRPLEINHDLRITSAL